MTKKTHLCFVYGTLKFGYGNHTRFLADQEFICEAKTLPFYRLYDNGAFPYLVEDRENGAACEGEIWRADEEAIRGMDMLEGVPHHYRREVLKIDGFDEPVFVYIYNGDPRKSCEDVTPVWESKFRPRTHKIKVEA